MNTTPGGDKDSGDSNHGDNSSLKSFGENTNSVGGSEPSSAMSNRNRTSSSGGLFFADATLDLDEAHDIAETPEPPRRLYVLNHKHSNELEMPTLLKDSSHNAEIDDDITGDDETGDGDDYDDGDYTSNNNQQNSFAAATAPAGSGKLNSLGSISSTGNNANSNASTSTIPSMKALTTTAVARIKRQMNRITSDSFNEPSSLNGNNLRRPQSLPRWPRDLQWAILFCLFVPVSLLWPIIHSAHTTYVHNKNVIDPSPLATARPLTHSSFYTLFLAYGSTIILSRVLYRTVGGGDGDDARHVASEVLLAAAPISVFSYVALIISIYILIPHALIIAIIPLWYLVRDVVLYRRWKRRYSTNTTNYANTNTRYAFFQALVCMALDILSRSLRRITFHRVISSLLLLQLFVVCLWRWAILSALAVNGNHASLLLLIALLGGKWATGTVARLLSLIASGGIASWFVQQTHMMEEMEQMQSSSNNRRPNNENISKSNNNNNADETGNKEEKKTSVEQDNDADNNHHHHYRNANDASTITEAYRTVDASVYQSVLSMEDDGIDDDDELEDEFDMEAPAGTYNMAWMIGDRQNSSSTNNYQQHKGSTVKSFLISGLTISFGSVARCGLTGGLAQFIWCQLRKVEEVETAIAQGTIRFPGRGNNSSSNSNNRGFQGMQIEASDTTNQNRKTMQIVLSRINLLARDFVRSHSDLAMSHVAAYYKTYYRAARDVAILVDQSGVEPIIHDDITTHMCACVGGSITAFIVIITAFIVAHQRHNLLLAGKQSSDGVPTTISDAHIAENMILIFILCYTIIFTVMEPLRASIKAVYVCFAQHPRSLRQAFPLIFHRLSRISESNMS